MSKSEEAVTNGKGKTSNARESSRKKTKGKAAVIDKPKGKGLSKKEGELSKDKSLATKRKRTSAPEKETTTSSKKVKTEETSETSKQKEKKGVSKPRTASTQKDKKIKVQEKPSRKGKVQEKPSRKGKVQEKTVKKRHSSQEGKGTEIGNNLKEEKVKAETNGDKKDIEDKKQVVAKTTSKKKKKANDEPVPRPLKYESLGEGPPPVPSTGKMYVGCHVSGAGGVWNAFDNAEECEAKSLALFLRNQRQWVAKPLDDATVEKWVKAMKDMPPHLILPHGSYLMNLGSAVPEGLDKSRKMLLEEIQRCEKLGIPHYNFHPGSTVGKISREECCKTIAESINIVLEQTKGVICVLENMSCQGFAIGGDFHELRTIIEHVKDKTRVGVCLDTCHAHAAGYDLGTEAGFLSMLDDFGKIIGWQFLRGLHINDSKGGAGDHLDRHENIGKGKIGIEGFRRVMNCPYFKDLPFILETPWTDNKGYAKEIKILEGLIAK